MTDNNGWPDKPGVPPNEGWWWILLPLDVQGIRYFDGELWRIGGQLADPKDFATYALIGPVLTPAEVEARVAQARRDALEDCAKWHDEVASEYKKELSRISAQLLYEAKESWTVAYVFAQGYVINNKRAAAIRALKCEGND